MARSVIKRNEKIIALGRTQAISGSNITPNQQYQFIINGNFTDNCLVIASPHIEGASAENTFIRTMIYQGNAIINFIFTGTQYVESVKVYMDYIILKP